MQLIMTDGGNQIEQGLAETAYTPHVMRPQLISNRGFKDFSELWTPLSETIPQSLLRSIGLVNLVRFDDRGGYAFSGKVFGAVVIGKHEKTETVDSVTGFHQSAILMNAEPSVKIDRDDFRTVFIHELGHAIFENITTDDSNKWREMTEDDRTDVTEYVHDRRQAYLDQDPMNEAKKAEKKVDLIKDDFCETFTLFNEMPGLLQIISKGRFEYMETMFEKYDKDPVSVQTKMVERNRKVEEYKQRMKSMGYSEERIRNEYNRYPLDWAK